MRGDIGRPNFDRSYHKLKVLSLLLLLLLCYVAVVTKELT